MGRIQQKVNIKRHENPRSTRTRLVHVFGQAHEFADFEALIEKCTRVDRNRRPKNAIELRNEHVFSVFRYRLENGERACVIVSPPIEDQKDRLLKEEMAEKEGRNYCDAKSALTPSTTNSQCSSRKTTSRPPRKFPDASEELLLVSVGNLIYYRFLNPTICAPEAFDVIDLPAGTALDQKTRKKLGQIARFLQHSASFTTGKDIADGSLPPKTAKHETIQAATVLNSKRFRTFFKAVINVAEPEEFFQMSKYSDVVEIEKPKITLTIKDLLEAHKLLLQFSDSITADQNDQLHDILAEIKDIPEPETLLDSDIRNIKNQRLQLPMLLGVFDDKLF